ncbi:glutathione S-transferase [Chromatiales bacterium (ex Bugula neritina AB1)]|nr:glutathione S-transferase [Chromatiales bacterium (ex Bugula neritina AB1)]
MITLYDYELSGNCYKIRLLLSILGIEYTSHTVEFYPAAEHNTDWFQQINPLRQLPVLLDDNFTLRESQAILVYLASCYDKSRHWYPTDNPQRLALVSQWLAFADSITGSASRARLVEGFFYNFDVEACRTEAHRLFRILDEHLWFNNKQNQQWIVAGDNPTIADIACFPYIMLSEEGSISRQDYPAIRRWADQVKRIPGFIVMPGIFPAGPAA